LKQLHFWVAVVQYQTGLKLPILVSVRCDNLTELFRSYYMLEQVVKNRAYVIVDKGSTFYKPDDVLPTNQQSKH